MPIITALLILMIATIGQLLTLHIPTFTTFISRHRRAIEHHTFTTSADSSNLHGKQLATYNLVKDHMLSNQFVPLHMIISGTAGTGKSYLINCLRLLLVCCCTNGCQSFQY